VIAALGFTREITNVSVAVPPSFTLLEETKREAAGFGEGVGVGVALGVGVVVGVGVGVGDGVGV
jgi:hypothetical protein